MEELVTVDVDRFDRLEAKVDDLLATVAFIKDFQALMLPAMDDMKANPLKALGMLTQMMRR